MTETEFVEQTDSPSTPNLSRRQLFSFGAIATAMFQATPSRAQLAPPAGDILLKLVRRITNGLNPEEVSRAQQLGFYGYLDYHLNYDLIDDSALDLTLNSSFSDLFLPGYKLYQLPSNQGQTALMNANVLRSIVSKRQLFERMVEFWTDHFNIDINKVGVMKVQDDLETIRANAMTSFPQILSASAHSPSMMVYLDNASSTKTAPNQNYARELMELHSMGVDGGYTQDDVIAVAKCFTGWGYIGNTGNEDSMTWYFTLSRHDQTAKTVLGNSIGANGGVNDGNIVLSILSNHASTQKNIAKKLCKWLLRYDPPQDLIDKVAAIYQNTGGDVKEMIRSILTPKNLEIAPLLYKRPTHLVASAVRGLGATITSTSSLRGTYLSNMGMVPYNWSPPNGYPHSVDYWAGLILPRWNFGFLLANGSISGVSYNLTTFLAGAVTPTQVANRINSAFFGGEMASSELASLTTYLGPTNPTTTKTRDAIGLAISSPSFQWY